MKDQHAFLNIFPLLKLTFFYVFVGVLGKQLKISHLVDFDYFDWEKCTEIARVVHIRVPGMPNTLAQVSSLYHKWFLKNQNFRRQVA